MLANHFEPVVLLGFQEILKKQGVFLYKSLKAK
jgi:hypothetical protein